MKKRIFIGGIIVGLILPKVPKGIKKLWNVAKENFPDNQIVVGIDKYIVKPCSKKVEKEAEILYDDAEELLNSK